MAAFYRARLIFLTFYGQPRMSHEVEHHIHESPKSMTGPLVVLAICSVCAGWLGVPSSLGGTNAFGKFLEPVFAQHVAASAAPVPPLDPPSEAHHGWARFLFLPSSFHSFLGWLMS